MTTAVKNIMIRTIKARLAAGESWEQIIESYPKLTEDEIAELAIACCQVQDSDEDETPAPAPKGKK